MTKYTLMQEDYGLVNPLRYGDGSPTQATLEAAIAAVGGDAPLLLPPVDRLGLPCTWVIGSNLTITNPLRIPQNPVQVPVRVASGVTLTLAGALSAPDYPLFDADQITTGTLALSGSGQTVSAKWLGATGDGVTDDWAALQAACDLGVPVYLPPGTYMVSARLVVTDRTCLLGAGMDQTVIKWRAGVSASSIVGFPSGQSASYVRIADMTFDGNRAANGDGGQAGLQFGDLRYSVLERLRVTGMDGHSIQLSGQDSTTASHHNVVRDCRVDDYGSSDQGGAGIFLFRGAHHNKVIGCVVSNAGAPLAQGGGAISSDDWSSVGISAAPHHNIVMGCTVEYAYRGLGCEGMQYSIYANNTIEHVQSQGMWIGGGVSGTEGRTDIEAYWNVIQGNVLHDCLVGIREEGLYTACTGNTITGGNTGIHRGSGPLKGWSVWSGNSVQGTALRAIQITNGTNLLVTGNLLTDCGTNGIHVLRSTGGGFDNVNRIVLQGNFLTNVQQHGILLDEQAADLARIRVAGNTFDEVSLASPGTYGCIACATGNESSIECTDNLSLGLTAIAGVVVAGGVTSLWQFQNKQVGNAGETFTLGTTGFTSNPSGTARYQRDGNQVTLVLPNLTGTSNATTFTLTGIPAAIQVQRSMRVVATVVDNGTAALGYVELVTGSAWNVRPNAAGGSWTTSGTKTLSPLVLTYTLQ